MPTIPERMKAAYGKLTEDPWESGDRDDGNIEIETVVLQFYRGYKAFRAKEHVDQWWVGVYGGGVDEEAAWYVSAESPEAALDALEKEIEEVASRTES